MYKEHYDNLLAEDKVRAVASVTSQCDSIAAAWIWGRLKGIQSNLLIEFSPTVILSYG